MKLEWIILTIVLSTQALFSQKAPPATEADPNLPSATGWQLEPEILGEIEKIKDPEERKLTLYGKELFIHTAYYLGPKGTVAHNTSRMNCQNCHIGAGTRKYGNDLMQTAKRYPTYRPREGRVLSLQERINNCIERPLSGKPLPMESREMKGISAYITWLNTLPTSKDFKSGENMLPIKYIKRAASIEKGAKIFEQQCARCHGANGEGKLFSDQIAYAYPPLWGPESFSMGSSMTRVLKFAAFIKGNMPYGTVPENPLLTDEEAIDVAAFVVEPKFHLRPPKFDICKDFPNLEEKPIDLAIGPYIDPFSEEQHFLGPYGPIEEFYKKRKVASRK